MPEFRNKKLKKEYEMSQVRRNLLDWYQFNPGTALLWNELKPVHEMLEEKGLRVNCRAEELITGGTEESENNIENDRAISSENESFKDVPYEKKQYDYVILIDDIKCGEYITRDVIKKAAGFLNQNGTFILALDNCMGIKQLAGMADNHTGKAYDGLGGFFERNPIKGFSRKQLIQVLEENNLKNYKFYYPVPDYIFPTQIFSDDFLPSEGDFNEKHAEFYEDNYGTFIENTVMDRMAEDGGFTHIANSFLIICKA